MLSVTVEESDDTVVLHCEGRIVRGFETDILCAAAQLHRRNVILDLAAVEAIDAAGVGALISLQAAGIYLKLMNPSKAVREVLTVTHLDSIFEICESRSNEELIAAGATAAAGQEQDLARRLRHA